MGRLADRIANAMDHRHKVTHGLWDWHEEKPERLAVYSFRPGYSYEHRLDLEKLRGLLDTVGEILFELVFPGGLSDVEIGPYGSRYPGEVVKADPRSGVAPHEKSDEEGPLKK